MPERHDQIIRDVKARARHAGVTGAKSANATLRDFRAVYNAACRTFRELPRENPVYAVKEARERKVKHQIEPDDLRNWHAKVQAIGNPSGA